jgi:acyl dehydratase
MPVVRLPDLTALPPAGSLYFKAALTARRKPKSDAAIPANAVTLRGLKIEPAHLAAYNRVCELPEGTLLLTYPQVLAAPLHIHALIQPNYPFPLLGMVHVRNTITQHSPLVIGETYDVDVEVGESRRVPQGVEVEIHTRYQQGETVLWTAVTTVLHRLPVPKGPKKAPPPPPPAVTARYAPFNVPADIGRRYAPVAGDYNPIHLYPITAKALGFDRAIAHGMWSLARCAGLMLDALGHAPTRLTVQFKQPLLLPAKVTLKQIAGEGGFDFELLAREGGKTHLAGHLE